MQNNNVLTFTASDMQPEALKARGLILVDFWAAWCGPCRMLAPVLNEIAADLAGKLTFAKLNIDEQPDPAVALRVTSIPTLILFKDGVEQERLIGAVPKRTITETLSKYIAE